MKASRFKAIVKRVFKLMYYLIKNKNDNVKQMKKEIRYLSSNTKQDKELRKVLNEIKNLRNV